MWNRFEIAAERAPTDAERLTLHGRRVELEAALEPADPRTALSAISGMFMGFANTTAGSDPENVLMRAEAYVDCVRDQPIWAIRKACRDWRDGRHGSEAFAPSTAQFAPTVSAETLPFRHELGRLKAILDAKVIGEDDPEARARCFAMGMEAAAKMREEHEQKRQRAAARSLDALLAEAQPNMSADERKAAIEGMREGKGDPESRKVDREFTKAGEAFDVDKQGGP